MSLIDELKSLGVNVDEALDRVMGDQDLYVMMLGMFLSSVAENPVGPEDFDAGDLEGLIKKIHTLKGVTGNLGLTPLFNSYTESLGLLRDGDGKAAKAVYDKLVPVQASIIDCIQRYQ